MSYPPYIISSPLDIANGNNTAVTITYPAVLNDIQTINTTGTPTGGTFTLTFGGQTTATIAYNASAATVQTALNNLSSIGASGVTCYGGPLTTAPVLVYFNGTATSSKFQNVFTLTSNLLTGGTSPSVNIVHALPGGGTNYAHCISAIGWSYNNTPTGGNIIIQDGGDTVLDLDITQSGPGLLTFTPAKSNTPGNALTITLAAGGTSIVGKLAITHWIRQLP